MNQDQMDSQSFVLNTLFDQCSVITGMIELIGNEILHLTENQSLLEFFGIPQNRLSGTFASERNTNSEILKLWVENYRKAEASGRSVQFQYWQKIKGEQKYLSAVVSRIEVASHHPRFVFFIQDLTIFQKDNIELKTANENLTQRLIHKRLLLESLSEDLSFSEVRLSESFELASAGIVNLDRSGKFIRANRHFCNFVGYNTSELCELSFFHLLSEDQPGPVELLDFKEDMTDPKSYELRFHKKTGESVWANILISAVTDRSGQFLYHLIIVHDISEKRILENSTKEKDLLLQMTLNVSKVSTWEWNQTSDRLVYSSNGYEVFGLDAKHGCDFIKSVHPDDIEPVRQFMSEAAATGKTVKFRFRITRPDNHELRWIESRVRTSEDFNRRTASFCGISFDVTDREIAERAQNESSMLSRSFAESIPSLVWHADLQGKLTSYNRRWYEYTGQPRLDDLHETWRQSIDPEDEIKFNQCFQASLQNETHFQIEIRLKDSSGSYRWFLCQVSPFKNLQKQTLSWFGVLTEIEAQKKAQTIVENELKIRDEFLLTLSHEIKSPLTSLKLHLQILADKAKALKMSDDLTIDFEKNIETANRQVNRLIQLVENLLDISRIHLGRMIFQIEKVNLSVFIQEVVERYRVNLLRANCEVKIEVTENIFANLDPLKFEQVMINLLANVVKYASGTPLKITLKQKGAMAVLKIKDYGPGISKENQKRIFERFERATDNPKKLGLGLGLYISKKLIEAQNGKINLESGNGKGSSFSIEIPLYSDKH